MSRNKIVVLNLETGQSISRTATEPFSSERLVLADWNKAEVVLKDIIKELIPKKIFPRQFKLLIQQVGEEEVTLSQIEKRAMRDLGEQVGASKVVLVEGWKELSITEAEKLI